jgi:hypothetical protein
MGYWLLDIRYSMLDTRYSILGAGHQFGVNIRVVVNNCKRIKVLSKKDSGVPTSSLFDIPCHLFIEYPESKIEYRAVIALFDIPCHLFIEYPESKIEYRAVIATRDRGPATGYQQPETSCQQAR